jgi:hypothetical protein
MNWQPKVQSPYLVEVPLVTCTYQDSARRTWNAAVNQFVESQRKRYSVFREYSELAASGRFVLPFAGEAPARRFAELHTALMLEREHPDRKSQA